MKPVIFLFMLGVLQACGDDAKIADEVNYQVFFSRQQLQVEVVLNDEYSQPLINETEFDSLATVYSYVKDQKTTLGVLLHAAPGMLNQNWPVTRFGNSKIENKIESSSGAKDLLEWRKKIFKDLEVSLFFERGSRLVMGGAFWLSELNKLPSGIVGTQQVDQSQNEAKSFITVVGPTLGRMGGVIFLSHFESNPFVVIEEPEEVLEGFSLALPTP